MNSPFSNRILESESVQVVPISKRFLPLHLKRLLPMHVVMLADPAYFKPLQCCLMSTLMVASIILVSVVVKVTYLFYSGKYDTIISNSEQHMYRNLTNPMAQRSYVEELFEPRLRTFHRETGSFAAFYSFAILNLVLIGMAIFAARLEEYAHLVALIFVQLPVYAISTIYEFIIGIDSRIPGFVFVLLGSFTVAMRLKDKRQTVVTKRNLWSDDSV